MKRIAHRYSLLLAGALLFADQLAAQEWQGTYSSSGGSSAVVYKVEMLYYSAGGSGNDSDDGWELIGKLNLSLRDGSNASVKDFGAFAVWTGGKVTKGRHDWSSLQYFYCGSPESMNGGRVVISGSGLVDEDSGDSDDGISTPEQSTPLSGLTAGGAARSFSSSYNWTSKALVMDDGQGSLSINGKVSLIAIDDVPQAQRGNIDCGAEAAGKFKIVKTPGGTLLVTATASDFTGNMKPLGQVIAGTYTDYGGDYARNAGEFRFHMNGGSVTFYYKGKPYNFNREAGAASNVIQLPGQASGGSSAIGKWYGANVGDAGVDIMAGVDHELAFWVGDKSYDFDLAETQPSKVTKQYAQAGGSATMKVSKLKLTINGVEYYRDAPIAGKSRGGSGSAGMDVFSLVRTGDLETIAELKEEGMADLEARNSTGQTPLLAAAAMNNGDVVSGLIGLGASATAVGSDGKSALDHAAAKGNLDMVRTLMAAGCKATAPMIDAASAKPEVVMELVSGSNDPGLGSYAVTVASKKGNTELFKSLVETQSVPLSIAHFNNAVSDRRMEIALYVLEAPGIDMNAALTTSLGSGLRPLIERCLNKGASPAPALEYAVRKGDLDLTNLILSDYNGVATPVMPIAVGKGNIALVTALLDHDGDATAGLQAAVDSNKVAIARLLLGRGADPNKEMGNAARRGYDDLIKAMLENNGAADSGMQGAIEGDKPNTVTLLVNSGADPNPAMAYAVDKSYGTLLELLISKGGDATVSAYVATAAERGDVAILNILLEKGSASADPGMLPAVTNQGAGVVDILLKHGASGSSPVLIQKSVERGEVTTAGLLLNSGADASPADLIRVAVSQKNASMTGLLLEKGADANNGAMEAIKQNSTEILSLLKSKGAELGRAGYLAASALHNNTTLSGMLLDAGCAPQEGVVPAASSNASKVLDLLLAKGADLKDVKLIVTAVTNGYDQIAAVLVKGGCDPTGFVDPGSGGNLLHVATAQENFPMVQVLIGAKVDVNMKASGSGDTPLHVAARGGKDNLDCVMALVGAGSDVNATNSRGKSVIQEAKGPKIRKYLKSEGGERRPDK